MSLYTNYKKYLDENTFAVNLAYYAKRGSKLNTFLYMVNNDIIDIKRDKVAVKNSSYYDYNNGLAEGSVNKIKVI